MKNAVHNLLVVAMRWEHIGGCVCPVVDSETKPKSDIGDYGAALRSWL